LKASDAITDLQSIKNLLLSQARQNTLTRHHAENLLSLASDVLKQLDSAVDWERDDIQKLAELKQFFHPESVHMLLPEE
jgi:hypothetical protein